MLTLQSTRSLEYPRRKFYLNSLNELMERKIVIQPQIQVSNRLFPTRNFAKKLSISHQRVRSSIQMRTKKHDLHSPQKKAQNMLTENKKIPNKFKEGLLIFPSSQSSYLESSPSLMAENKALYATQSVFQRRSEEGILQKEGQSCSVSPKKSFLRKGSNLQKQIVVNLLRHKLIREREKNENKQYSNHEILKMIQVYKGVDTADSKSRKRIINLESKDQDLEKGKKRDINKQIKGWDQDTLVEDYEH